MHRHPKLLLLFIAMLFYGFKASSQGIIYENNFDIAGAGPYPNPYVYAPGTLDSHLSGSEWTLSSGTWTSYAGVGGNYALSTNSASPTTKTLDLSFNVASQEALIISGFSFFNRSSSTGYSKWDLLVNNVDVASGNIFVDVLNGSAPMQNTGTITLSSPIENLTGAVHVDLVLSSGAHGSNATFRLDEFTLIGSVYSSPSSGGGTNTLPSTAAGLSTSGTFNVSNMGGASYNIPIRVPAGFNGMQPNLSLDYSSQRGNGIMGMGWSLIGSSAISRVANNIYNDNNLEGVNLSTNDKFAFDGGRLVVINGSYGAASSQYHTENESFQNIVANGSLGNGPASFTVTDEKGWVYQYGETTNSLLQAATGTPPYTTPITTPYMWLIDKVTDLSGNYMTYQYTQYGDGETLLTQINYEGNTTTGLQPQGYITFTYVSRADPQVSYVGGGSIRSSMILSAITCFQQSGSVGRIARKYTLNYSNDSYTHLSSVTESGEDNIQSITPTQFVYGTNPTMASSSHPELSQQQTPDLYETFAAGDYNGDGKTDLIQFSSQNSNSGYSLFLNQGAGLPFLQQSSGTLQQEAGFGNNKNSLPLSLGIPFDYDGDGKDDFFYQQTNGTGTPGLQPQQKPWISLSTGTGINPLPYPIMPGASTTMNITDIFAGEYPLIGDFDGDGKSEVLEISVSGGISYLIGWEYNSVQYTLGDNSHNTIPFQVLVPYSFDGATHPNLPFTSDNNAKFYAIDYNGDGKTDILQVVGNTSTVWEINVTFSGNHPVLSSLTVTQVFQTGYPINAHNIFIGDFNGDHITDVLTYINTAGWQIGYGMGNGNWDVHAAPAGMAAPIISGTSYTRPIFVGDFNGDGKDDIYDALSSNQTQTYAPRIFSSVGNNSFTQEIPSITVTSPTADQGFWFGDFNGDGSVSMLTQGANYYAVPELYVFHPNDINHLVSKITDGYGAVTKINYLPLTDGSVYTPGSVTYTYPYIKRTIPFNLVSIVNADNGINSSGNNISYTYSGLKFHSQGKGLMGFDMVNSHDAASNIDNTQKFGLITQYAFPYLQTQTTALGGTILTQTTNNPYYIMPYAAGNLLIRPTQTSNVNFVNNISTTTSYLYSVPSGNPNGPASTSDNGQPLQITTDKGNGLEVTTQGFIYPNIGGPVYTYYNPSSVTTIITRQGQLSYTRTTNYAYTTGLPTSVITDPGTSNAVTNTIYYNSYAAVSHSSKSASGVQSIEIGNNYDPTNRFVATSSNTFYPAVSNTSVFDPVSGNTLSTTAADGLVTNFSYDAFGRVNNTYNSNGGAASISYGPASSFSSIAPSNAVYATATLPNTATSAYKFYDRLGRLIRSASPAFNSSDGYIYEDVIYNNLGQVSSKTKPYFASAAPQTISYTYDAQGRETQQAAPEGNTNISYTTGTNYAVTVTNPAGQSKITTTDLSGRTISVTDNGGTLTYTYHSCGQPNQISMSGSGAVAQITFDDYGRKIKQADPNYGGSGGFQYIYNPFGQIVTQQDPHGNSYSFTYDVLGNVLTKTGSEGVYTSTYNYSSNINSGKQIQFTGPGGVTQTYVYGKGDQVLSETRSIGTTQVLTTSHTYDNYGRLSTLTYPNGKQVSYTYSIHDGGLQGIDNATGNPLIVHYACQNKTAMGQVKAENQGGVAGSGINIGTNYTYDTYNFLSEKQSANLNTISLFKDLKYIYEPTTGNLLRRQDIGYNLREDFTYDNLNRLTNVQGQITGTNPAMMTPQTIDYVANGNITQKSDAGIFGYNQANMLHKIFPYTTVPDDEQDITYTPFNKVLSIGEATGGVQFNAQFTYWADGTRSSMSLSQAGALQKTKYYAPSFEREVDATTGVVRDLCYITGANGYIVAIMETTGGVDKQYYVLTDNLGSITQIIDGNGVVKEEKSFDAWGRARDPQSWAYLAPKGPSNGWDRGFTGHELIPQFGIINMNGRLYDPVMGRIFSPDDNIQAPYSTQSYNRYSYCMNNPLKYTDQSGELWGYDDLFVFVVGGLDNLYENKGNVHNFWQGLGYFAAGGIGADATYNFGPLASGVGGALNLVVDKLNGDIGKNSSLQDFAQSFSRGVVSSLSGAASGYQFDQAFPQYSPDGASGFENFINGGEAGVKYAIGSHTIGYFAYQGGLSVLNGFATDQYNFTDKFDNHWWGALSSFAGAAVASATVDQITGLNGDFDPVDPKSTFSAGSGIGWVGGTRLAGLLVKTVVNNDLSGFISSLSSLGTSKVSFGNIIQNNFLSLFPISQNFDGSGYNYGNAAATTGDVSLAILLSIFSK